MGNPADRRSPSDPNIPAHVQDRLERSDTDDGIRTRDPHLGKKKVTEVMPPTRPDEYSPCSGPIHRTPQATAPHRSQPPKVARKVARRSLLDRTELPSAPRSPSPSPTPPNWWQVPRELRVRGYRLYASATRADRRIGRADCHRLVHRALEGCCTRNGALMRAAIALCSGSLSAAARQGGQPDDHRAETSDRQPGAAVASTA